MVEEKSSENDSKNVIKGRSEDIEIKKDRKGLVVIDIPNNPAGSEDTPPHNPESDLKSLVGSLPVPDNIDQDKLRRAFELIDEGFMEEYEKSLNALTSADLNDIDLFKLNTRRSEMSILAFILKSTADGAKKTQILYEANLSGKQMKNYLTFLINSGCIEERAGKKKSAVYYTTAKGKVFLTYWTKILSLFESPHEEDGQV